MRYAIILVVLVALAGCGDEPTEPPPEPREYTVTYEVIASDSFQDVRVVYSPPGTDSTVELYDTGHYWQAEFTGYSGDTYRLYAKAYNPTPIPAVLAARIFLTDSLGSWARASDYCITHKSPGNTQCIVELAGNL